MKRWVKQNVLLLLILLVGIVAAGVVLAGRVQVEQNENDYDIVLDYYSVRDMAEQSGKDLEYWLKYFRDLGVERVALTDSVVSSLEEDSRQAVLVKTVQTVMNEYRWQEKYPEQVVRWVEDSPNKSDLLLICREKAHMDWIASGLTTRTDGAEFETLSEDGGYYVWVLNNAYTAPWGNADLGLWPETAELIQSCGMQVIPRPVILEDLNGEAITNAFLQDLERYGSPYYINTGAMFLGHDDEEKTLPILAEWFKTHDVSLGVVERSDQSLLIDNEGLENVLEAINYQAVRVFSMWDFVQYSWAKYGYEGPEEVVNCLYRAAYERTCRLIYLKMMADPETNEYITEPEAYQALIDQFRGRMDARGYSQQVLKAADYYDAGLPLRLVIAFGAVAAAVLLLTLIVPLKGKYKWGLLILGCLGAAGAMFVMPNTSKLILSIGGGIVLPCLALAGLNHWLAERAAADEGQVPAGRLLGFGAVMVLSGVVTSFLGSMFAAGALSETAFMLEARLYRGVKIMQLIPLLFAVCCYVRELLWPRYLADRVKKLPFRGWKKEDWRAAWNRLLDQNIKVKYIWYLLLAAVVVLVLRRIGGYYIARTGNANGISSMELMMRNFMEYVLPARPRTKEFLIGTPCVMLLAWSVRRRIPGLPLVFELGAAIGFTSVVNTFLHIRTPYLLNLVRVLSGLALGLVFGVIFVLIAEAVYRLILRRLQRRRHV